MPVFIRASRQDHAVDVVVCAAMAATSCTKMDCRADRHETGSQAAFLPARTFAHLARCAAAIFLLAAADNVRLGVVVVAEPLEVLFAQRAFCAKLIFFRAAAESVRPF